MREILITFILLAPIFTINAQQRDVGNRNNQQFMECSNNEYGFLIDGKIYFSNDQIYYCPDRFPIIITAVDKNGVPISDVNAKWEIEDKIGSIEESYGDHAQIRINENNLLNQRVKFKVTYKVSNNDEETLRLRLHRLTYLDVDEKSSESTRTYSFDENKIATYPYHGDGKPYAFYLSNNIDPVRFSTEHPNRLKMAKFKPISKINTVADDKGESLNINYTQSSYPDSVYLLACDTVRIAKLDIYPPKTLDVNIYTLAETDDDIANYCINKDGDNIPYENGDVDGSLKPDCKTKIDSKDWECVLPGPDGSLDLFNNLKSWRRKDNNASLDFDTLQGPENLNHLRKVYAGNDKFCNVRPLPNDTADYEDVSSKIIQISQNLNSIYNKVGVTINLNYLGVKYFNFDSSNDNGNGERDTADIYNNAEQRYVHLQLFGGQSIVSLNIAPVTTLFFVPKMKGVYGRATAGTVDTTIQNIAHSFFVDANTFRIKTIAHELGHARFGLWHPDGSYCKKNSGDDAYKYNGLKKPTNKNDDPLNLMNSGCFPSGNLLRRFQWKIIHSKI
jgi:hypothetical protein